MNISVCQAKRKVSGTAQVRRGGGGQPEHSCISSFERLQCIYWPYSLSGIGQQLLYDQVIIYPVRPVCALTLCRFYTDADPDLPDMGLDLVTWNFCLVA